MKLLKMASPVTLTKGAVGLAGTAVGVAETLTRETAHLALSGLHRLAGPGELPAGAERDDSADDRHPSPPTDAAGPATDEAAEPSPVSAHAGPPKPSVVLAEPHAPEEPPIDVVGQALAAEAALGDRERPEGAGVAHEPRVASRDEEHGDARWQRVEVEEIDDDVTAALEESEQD